MVKHIVLDEIIIDANKSNEKERFLKLCAKRINEAVEIWAEQNINFDYNLAQNKNPFSLIIEGSKFYDAEIRSGSWCYVDFVSTNKESKYRVNVHRADRNSFLFDYRGQTFIIRYGKIPTKK